jgi:hypothetical protein
MSLLEHFTRELPRARSDAQLDALCIGLNAAIKAGQIPREAVPSLAQLGKERRELLAQARSLSAQVKASAPTHAESEEEPFCANDYDQEEMLLESYEQSKSRDDLATVRGLVEKEARAGRFNSHQLRRLFQAELAALKRIADENPVPLCPEAQAIFDELRQTKSRDAFPALLERALALSIQPGRDREFWALDAAFEIRAAELRQEERARKTKPAQTTFSNSL